MFFDRPDFFAAPFPSDDLRTDGGVDLSRFPNPANAVLVEDLRALLQRDARGFARTGGVFFSLTGPVDAAQLRAQLVVPGSTSSVPLDVTFDADAGPLGASNQVALLPTTGVTLSPSTTYAAVLSTSGLVASTEMQQLAQGTRPAGMPPAAFAEYERALDQLADAGTARAEIAGIAVFTTDDPTAGLSAAASTFLNRPHLTPAAPLVQNETFPGFCVFSSTVAVPDALALDGGWRFDAGTLVTQRLETARLVVTVPRSAMPAQGYPITAFVRAGGGADRPLVDRGTEAMPGGPALAAGTGPARYLAEVGLAGASVDGPFGGARNFFGANERYLVLNWASPGQLRDNLRESAIELVMWIDLLGDLTVDASGCPGAAPTARFDRSHVTLMGHDYGASIAVLAAAVEPRFQSLAIDGPLAGWVSVVTTAQEPVPVDPLIAILLGDPSRIPTAHDPALTLYGWALEPADPLLFAPAAGAARSVLLQQGVPDGYTPPPVTDALAVSMPLDWTAPTLLPPPAGAATLALPITANRNGQTHVVAQYPYDAIEDGHQVVFQLDAPKHRYKCFLSASGAPVVTDAGAADDPCP
jgi:hypothetical protein